MGGGSPAARFTADGSPDARRRGAAARQDVSSPSHRARVGPGSPQARAHTHTHTRRNATHLRARTYARAHLCVRGTLAAIPVNQRDKSRDYE